MTAHRRRLMAAGALLLTSVPAVASDAADAAARARDRVGRVFARPEFDPLADAEKIPRPHVQIDTSWLRPFAEFGKGMLDTIGDVLRAIFGGLRNLLSLGRGAGDAASLWAVTLVWLLVAVAAGLLVWLLLRARRARRLRAAGGGGALIAPAAGTADDALSRTPEDWRRRAAELAAGGHGRESLRALYLALLAELHRLGAVRYDRSRTNTAYVGDVPSRHPARKPFASLTRRFDRCWYGGRDVAAPDLRTAQAEADDVIRAFREEVRVDG